MIFVEGMNEILKIIKPSEDLGLFIDEIGKTIENEIRKKKKNDLLVYFRNVRSFSQEILNKTKGKLIALNIFRIQSDNSIICKFYCFAFIEGLLEYTNLFSPNDYKNNGKVIYKYFKDKYDKRKHKSRL